MNFKEIDYNNKKLVRINERKVKNIINNKSKLENDIIIYCLPCKLDWTNFWNEFYELEVEKTNIHMDSIELFNLIREYKYYNCNNETGLYLRYYIEK